jgi:hypothetical protein
MQVTCPACGSAYTVGPQHIGKSFPCRSCGTTVTVPAPTAPVPGGAPAAAPVMPPAAAATQAEPADAVQAISNSAAAFATGRVLQQKLMTRVRADVASWALGVGVVVVLFFMFMPVLDAAKVARRHARVTVGDAAETRLDRDLNTRAARGGAAPTAAEMDGRKKARDEWQKRREELEDDAADAVTDLQFNRYWYTWGAMGGSLLVAVSAMNYLAVGQTRTRRVVGGVLICFVVILVLTTFNLISVTASLGGKL